MISRLGVTKIFFTDNLKTTRVTRIVITTILSELFKLT